jgi:hypothetical protein
MVGPGPTPHTPGGVDRTGALRPAPGTSRWVGDLPRGGIHGKRERGLPGSSAFG